MSNAQTTISRLLKTMTPDDARKFAKKAGTSVPYLRHISKARRDVSCAMAWRIVEAADKMGIVIPQTDLCAACKAHA
jgi:hypothetical protein